MPLSDIKDPNSVIKAVEEFDELGRDNFLKRYGFKKARSYYLKLNNSYYDSKAIVGVAHKYSPPNIQPLKSEDFSGGEGESVRILKKLGFKVIKTKEPTSEKAEFPYQAYSWKALSAKIFVKYTDKSCFLHHGTGVPFVFKQYLKLEDISSTKKIKVLLNYKGTKYNAHFEMTKSHRTRLMWNSDFSDILNSTFPKWSEAFSKDIRIDEEPPKIKLTKRDEAGREFDVELIEGQLESVTEEVKEWSNTENRLIVNDYFQMLKKEINGDAYNKTEHRTQLMKELPNRSKGSVEFKHQNISAVLAKMGLPYVQGYKPRFNIQAALVKGVERYLDSAPDINSLLKEVAQKAPSAVIEVDFNDVLSSPPELTDRQETNGVSGRIFKPRKVDYGKRESENRSLGQKGEEFVIRYEQNRLTKAGRKDLIDKIRHVSKEDGDGAGFDILSFTEDGKKLLIEVKTTRSGKYSPFYMSSSEKDFLSQNEGSYWLYRVFNYDKQPQIYTLSGNDLLKCNFDVSQYTVSF